MSHNYFAEAKELINKKSIPNFEKAGLYTTVDFMTEVIKQGTDAVKFTLPDDGKLIEDNLKGLNGSILKLPYPLILIEYAAQQPPAITSHNRAFSNKRIIIAKEVDDEIRVYSIYTSNLKKHKKNAGGWSISLGYISIKQNTNTIVVDPLKVFPDSVQNVEIKTICGTSIPMMPMASLRSSVYSDCIEEVLVLFNMLEALSCSNVSIVNEKRLNNQNISKPASLQSVYKVLSINSTKLNSSIKTTENAGEYAKESSKRRQHTRRGHIRNQRYKNCVQKIWINPVIVNPQTSGTVFKEYTVR